MHEKSSGIMVKKSLVKSIRDSRAITTFLGQLPNTAYCRPCNWSPNKNHKGRSMPRDHVMSQRHKMIIPQQR